jgi:hypothetical protein
MLLQAFYIKNLDEIDSVKLRPGEVKARKIAKTASVMPAFVVYALFLPLLMLLHYCHQPTQDKVQSLIFNFIVKPIRWLCYQAVFLLFNLIFV